jgi:sRNA-binding carbon storage regulator CsrA
MRAFQGEKLLIADDIVVTVLAVEGATERIDTDTPNCVQVERIEVLDRRLSDGSDKFPVLNEFDICCPVG